MADLTSIEKLRFEHLFGMGSGYVLDFSNRTFQEFMLDNAGLDIYDEKYNYSSGSKANRLRAFWASEPDSTVGITMMKLLEYWIVVRQANEQEITPAEQNLYDECVRICERLTSGGMIETIDAIQPYEPTKEYVLLAKSIRKSIEENEPEAAIDRLHTYLVKYVRSLCDKHAISYEKDTPLHSLFGSYVKHLRKSHAIDSEITERILKSTISILDSLNQVRNDNSLAHDNPVLNYDESMLILNHVSGCIRFIQAIESDGWQTPDQEGTKTDWDGIPF